MALEPNAVTLANSNKAVYVLKKLPNYGKLTLAGKDLKLDDTWTQLDIASGALKYRQTTGLTTINPNLQDEFHFSLLLEDGSVLSTSSFKNCLPEFPVPDDGIYVYVLDIIVLDRPQSIRNLMLTVMEDDLIYLTRNDLYYSADIDESAPYVGDLELAVPTLSTENFRNWTLQGEWQYTGQDNTAKRLGLTSTLSTALSVGVSDAYTLQAEFSSPYAGESGLIGFIVAKAGPKLVIVGRQGTSQSWGVFESNSGTLTTLADHGSLAPLPVGTSAPWAALNPTKVRVARDGLTITARCSQFDDALAELDADTEFTFELPVEYSTATSYGMASEVPASFVNLYKGDNPDAGVFLHNMIERVPTAYRVNNIPTSAQGEFQLNGVPLKAGDGFTHAEIDNGKLSVRGRNNSQGFASFTFTATTIGPASTKATSGTFTAQVVAWPFPETIKAEITLNACEPPRALTPQEINFGVQTGSTPAQISIVKSTSLTNAANPAPVKFKITPEIFTQKDINDGNVQIEHVCDSSEVATTERIVFNVCTNHGKCSSKTVIVNIVPTP